MLDFLDLVFVIPVTRILESPIDDTLGVLLLMWWVFPFFFVMLFSDFAILGGLIAIGLAPWRRVADRRLLYRAKCGAGIGIMVGCTYYTISSTIFVINRFARTDDCILILPEHVYRDDIKTMTPYLRAAFPADGATCLSLSIESIAFFLTFIALGIGVAYVRGRIEESITVKETVTVGRLVKGAVFGLLTAGTLTPIMILLDILFYNLWHWIGMV